VQRDTIDGVDIAEAPMEVLGLDQTGLAHGRPAYGGWATVRITLRKEINPYGVTA
jgi:hypothetical protein